MAWDRNEPGKEPQSMVDSLKMPATQIAQAMPERPDEWVNGLWNMNDRGAGFLVGDAVRKRPVNHLTQN
jgi:hypothetical protein